MINFKKILYFFLLIISLLVVYLFGINSGFKRDFGFQKILEMKKLLITEKKELNFQNMIFKSNDFEINLSTNKYYKYKTHKTAGILELNDQLIIFEQEDLVKIWNTYQLKEFIKNSIPYIDKNGGIKKIFSYEKNLYMYATLSNYEKTCIYGSIINLTNKTEILRMPCLPDINLIDLNGMGGGLTIFNKGFLLAIGTPTNSSELIDMLAQDIKSPYGKILYFSSERMHDNEIKNNEINIYSLGHRNPQGLVNIEDEIFAVEHGPKGGDEVNKIYRGQNYGWPLFSIGSKYTGEFYTTTGPSDYTAPIFSFLPSVGLSNIIECPSILRDRYNDLTCLLLSSLRGQSIYILLIDNIKNNTISIERIDLGMRIRHFYWPKNISTNNLVITTDGYGAFDLVFSKLSR
jgi:glucose/arabinose dehydrogenase